MWAGPDVQKDRRWVRREAGGCFSGTCLGHLQAGPHRFQSCLSDPNRGNVGMGARRGEGRAGQGVWTNWHIHDRCLLRKIQ